jgi:hypothetical protein
MLVLAPLRLNWVGFDAVRRPDGVGPQVDARCTSGNAEVVPSDQKSCLARVSGACLPVDALP